MMSAIDFPLVVDLDGTLTPTDTLVESIIKLIKQSPLNLLRLPFQLMRGRSEFKSWVASRVGISAEVLPYRESLLAYLKEEKAKGRRIVLATAAHRSIADGVAAHLGLFDHVMASDDGGANLKGPAKLAAIQKEVGGDFVYAGDSSADIPVWKGARAAVLVNVSAGVAADVRKSVPVEREISREKTGLAVWLKALRVHQWMKNLLLFVPMLTAFSFSDPTDIVHILVAFVAFSLTASATYVVNDLWDLESDRAHPRKSQRPFASARLPIQNGLAVAAVFLVAAFAMALSMSLGLFLILLVYLVLTSAYSWVLKEYVLMDVIMLSVLYTLRIVAGAIAIEETTSSWLLAFSVFVFLSLALVKRCAELVTLEQAGKLTTKGRDYRVTDLVVLWPLGVGAALSAVVVFGLFISAPETQGRYLSPQLLWFTALGLIYWLSRLWVKTSRGEMHDDPVVYALKDRGSRLTVIGMVVVMLIARFFPVPGFL
ncbi:UbiA family prenyltransferase [Hydrogenophaga sp.]|uniref:UbiA family prenyltransferase n=1 Tax=Hydrogenophaga sp. TaxID=1904254 RepID=UPI00262FA254|nr:UbiA family prenyltransferase [Hydrogenophaga sp.]MCW5652285.1 UbiA family prenyltransferase [Hydrogenophaga sp.]